MGNSGSGHVITQYEVGKHPGFLLLPPRNIMDYNTLPLSVRGQIYDGDSYDLYGKMGIAFDDTFIDGP